MEVLTYLYASPMQHNTTTKKKMIKELKNAKFKFAH